MIDKLFAAIHYLIYNRFKTIVIPHKIFQPKYQKRWKQTQKLANRIFLVFLLTHFEEKPILSIEINVKKDSGLQFTFTIEQKMIN